MLGTTCPGGLVTKHNRCPYSAFVLDAREAVECSESRTPPAEVVAVAINICAALCVKTTAVARSGMTRGKERYAEYCCGRPTLFDMTTCGINAGHLETGTSQSFDKQTGTNQSLH